MSTEEAEGFFYFNIKEAYFEKGAPVYMLELLELLELLEEGLSLRECRALWGYYEGYCRALWGITRGTTRGITRGTCNLKIGGVVEGCCYIYG